MSKKSIDVHIKNIEDLCDSIKSETDLYALETSLNEIQDHLDTAKGFLPSVLKNKQEDGIYLYVESKYIPEPHNIELINYQKSLEAQFSPNGDLVSLKDKDGNDWMNWKSGVKWDKKLDSHI